MNAFRSLRQSFLARRTSAALVLCVAASLALSGASIFPPESRSGALQADDRHVRTTPIYYRVRNGDTLSEIAHRRGLSTSRLARMNRMGVNDTLRVGKRLVVGYRRELVRGKQWETIAGRTRVQIPFNYTIPSAESRTWTSEDFTLKVWAQKFAQGNAAYLELLPPEGRSAWDGNARPKIFFGDEEIPLARRPWGYRAIFAIAPNAKPGLHRLEVRIERAGEDSAAGGGENETAAAGTGEALEAIEGVERLSRYGYTLGVRKTNYPESTWRVNMGPPDKRPEPDPELIEQIQAASRKKRQVFAINSADKLGQAWSHPRNLHKITSAFYTARKTEGFYYQDGRRVNMQPTVRRHRGTDLRGRTGEPIYAMADGKVVLAERMHFEGNFIVIDHGNQIFTGYMHQSRMRVRVGQQVRAGQHIGDSGATGRVTGAHLHMSLWIRGVPVEPLSLLSLPLRK